MTMVAPSNDSASNVLYHQPQCSPSSKFKTLASLDLKKSPTIKSHKKVRFELECTDDDEHDDRIKEHIIERLEPLSEQEKEDRWYSLQDYAKIKKENSDIARGLRSQQLNSHAFSYTKTVMRVYASCFALEGELAPTDAFLLNKWAMLGHLHRGLERQSVPTVTRHIKKEKLRVITQVLSTQTNLVQEDDEEERAACIAQISMKLSAPARFFALALAQADEVAAQHENCNDCNNDDCDDDPFQKGAVKPPTNPNNKENNDLRQNDKAPSNNCDEQDPLPHEEEEVTWNHHEVALCS